MCSELAAAQGRTWTLGHREVKLVTAAKTFLQVLKSNPTLQVNNVTTIVRPLDWRKIWEHDLQWQLLEARYSQ